jgi:N-acetylneuraminic acid mutarotase
MNAPQRVLSACLLWLLPAGTALAQGTWASKAPMPTARSAPAAGALGNALHVVAGYQGGAACTYLNKHEAYDPATNTWSTKAALSWNPDQPGSAVVMGQLFVIGGLVNCGGSYSDVASYHPAQNAWTPRALLPQGRGAMGVGVIDGIIYVVGGSDGQAVKNTVYAYNIANNTWTARATMITARMGMATAVVDNLLYAIGGWNGSAGVATVEAYNPATNTWMPRASMPAPRSFFSAAAVNGKIYVIGGGYSSPIT